MKLHLLTAAALALSLATAPVAFAQSGGSDGGSSATGDASGQSNQPAAKTDEGTTSSTNTNEGMTDADKKFYSENNKWLAGFYTDDSMSTLKSDAEVAAAFKAAGAEDQAGMKAACDAVQNDRGSHGSVTIALCQQIGAL